MWLPAARLSALSICLSCSLTGSVFAGEEADEKGQPQARKRDGFRGQGAGRLSNLTAEQRQRIMKRFDANSNGRLEPAELQAARRAFAQRNKDANNKNPANKNPANKSRDNSAGGKKKAGPAGARAGQLSPQQRAAFLRRFDANKNGRLDPPEIARARSMMRRDRPSAATDKRPQRRTDRPDGANKGRANDKTQPRSNNALNRLK